MEIHLEQIRELMQMLTDFDLTEIALQEDGQSVVLKRASTAVTATATATAEPGSVSESASASASTASETAAEVGHPPRAKEEKEEEGLAWVTSPFVGSYYAAASPSSAPYVQLGDVIQLGQTLCIIEAMKMMNEIEADTAGTVVELRGVNGAPVEFGERLFCIKTA